jgi:hypothetical protein
MTSWGDAEWANCEQMMKMVFPDRDFFELPLAHPALSAGCFRDRGQSSSAPTRCSASVASGPASPGKTTIRATCGTVHHRAIADAKGRLMVLALHDADTGDGSEREGESDYYFHTFSRKDRVSFSASTSSTT